MSDADIDCRRLVKQAVLALYVVLLIAQRHRPAAAAPAAASQLRAAAEAGSSTRVPVTR